MRRSSTRLNAPMFPAQPGHLLWSETQRLFLRRCRAHRCCVPMRQAGDPVHGPHFMGSSGHRFRGTFRDQVEPNYQHVI